MHDFGKYLQSYISLNIQKLKQMHLHDYELHSSCKLFSRDHLSFWIENDDSAIKLKLEKWFEKKECLTKLLGS